MQTETQISQLLDFYIESGVDETIGEEPVNRFLQPAPAAPARARQTPAPRKPNQAVQQSSPAAPTIPSSQAIEEAAKSANACATIADLEKALQDFDGCSLKRMATHTVFARGNPDSGIMIIDRPASSEEDRTGLPFAGDAGALLTKMLASIGLKEDDVYLAGSIPWRPPGGRAPTKEEQALCLPFIRRHIEIAAPHTVILCGEAASMLMEQKSGINRLRGKWNDLKLGDKTIRALPIFHPAFLLDHPASKKFAWADLLSLKAVLAEKT